MKRGECAVEPGLPMLDLMLQEFSKCFKIHLKVLSFCLYVCTVYSYVGLYRMHVYIEVDQVLVTEDTGI